MRSSRLDYSCPDKCSDRVIASWDGYSSYLLIVDEASCFILVFLTKSKDPPIDIIDKFLQKFGHADGGSIRTDQGGELAGSSAGWLVSSIRYGPSESLLCIPYPVHT